MIQIEYYKFKSIYNSISTKILKDMPPCAWLNTLNKTKKSRNIFLNKFHNCLSKVVNC